MKASATYMAKDHTPDRNVLLDKQSDTFAKRKDTTLPNVSQSQRITSQYHQKKCTKTMPFLDSVSFQETEIAWTVTLMLDNQEVTFKVDAGA